MTKYLNLSILGMLLLLSAVSCRPIVSISEEDLLDKIRGGWAGKVIGVQAGQPYEFWYLGRTNDGELLWDDSYIKGALGQDDIFTQMSFMQTFDKYGLDATSKQLGEAFAYAGFGLCHANLQGRKNIFDGIDPPLSGSSKNNAHADDIDFQIDADFIGFMCPGMPRAAAKYCERIGCIMNDGDGIYGGIFIATLHTLAFFESDIPVIVEKALESIPEESAYARCVKDVLKSYEENPQDWRAAWQKIHDKWEAHTCTPNHPFNIDAKINGAYVAIGLLFGEGDFDKTVEIAIRCGQDSDCNASNAAAVWGIINGYGKIPEKYKSALDAIKDSKFAFTDYSITDATEKVMAFIGENVKRNGGRFKDGEYFIKYQTPRFRGQCVQSFPGMRYSTSMESDNPGWTYTGQWERFTEGDDAPFIQTCESGAAAEIEFEGRMVTLIGAWDSDCGIADIFIDGKKVRSADSYYPSRCGFQVINRQVITVLSGLPGGKHTLKIVNTSEKSPKSSGNRLMFTRIDVYDDIPS